MALGRLDADETTLISIEGGSGNGGQQIREVNVVTESGLYSLVLSSRKPEAKAGDGLAKRKPRHAWKQRAPIAQSAA